MSWQSMLPSDYLIRILSITLTEMELFSLRRYHHRTMLVHETKELFSISWFQSASPIYIYWLLLVINTTRNQKHMNCAHFWKFSNKPDIYLFVHLSYVQIQWDCLFNFSNYIHQFQVMLLVELINTKMTSMWYLKVDRLFYYFSLYARRFRRM